MIFCSFIALLAGPAIARGQQYSQQSANPLTAPITGDVIDETTEAASVHTLAWSIVGTPSSCTIAIETSASATGSFATLGNALTCVSGGSFTFSDSTAKYVRINLSAFAGSGASLTYSYGGLGSLESAEFASASLWAKLDALRAVEALRHGISKIDHCEMFVPVPGPSPVPYPTEQEFQLYSEPFGSSLNLAASFGDSGANGVPSAQGGIQTEALGQVQFESEHFFYNWKECFTHRPTVSFGGTIGLAPALVMENLTSATATISSPKNRPMFQDAFVWSLGPKLNVLASHMSQLTGFANLGQTYLLNQVISFKQGDDTVTATPVSNGVGQTALFWEAGVEWKLFNTDFVNAYINKVDVLDPPFDISVGYRNDGRFRHFGDLAGIADPQAYAFIRFSVGLNKIINWNGSAVAPGKGYTFKFGVDYERPLGGSSMPSATRFFVSANFDIMQVFKPSTQAPAPTGQAAPAQQKVAPHAVF